MKANLKNLSLVIVIFTLSAFSICSVTAQERKLKLVPDNAALVYWQAFALMPTLSDKENQSMIIKDKPTPI